MSKLDMIEELTPRERRHQRTQQAILEAARSIVAEAGADGLSIRGIADRIDYSPAGLYEYYGSKEEIIHALAHQGHRELKRYLASVDRGLAHADYIVELGMAYVRFALQNPDYFLLMFTYSTESHIRTAEERQAEAADAQNEESAFPILVAAIAQAEAAGVINYLPEMTLMDTSYAFWAIAHGAAMLRIDHLKQTSANFDLADRRMFEALIRGLKP